MIINITIYKNVKLVITPLEWFIWPVVKRGNVHRRRYIKIPKYNVARPWTIDQHQQELIYSNQTKDCVWFLCFQFHFLMWHPIESIASIYPAKYNWQHDPHHFEKYNLLCDTTDYFC